MTTNMMLGTVGRSPVLLPRAVVIPAAVGVYPSGVDKALTADLKVPDATKPEVMVDALSCWNFVPL